MTSALKSYDEIKALVEKVKAHEIHREALGNHDRFLVEVFIVLTDRGLFKDGELTSRGDVFIQQTWPLFRRLYGKEGKRGEVKVTWKFFIGAILEGLKADHIAKHNSQIEEIVDAWDRFDKSVKVVHGTLADIQTARDGVAQALTSLRKVSGFPGNALNDIRFGLDVAITNLTKIVPSELELARLHKHYVEPALVPVKTEFEAVVEVPETVTDPLDDPKDVETRRTTEEYTLTNPAIRATEKKRRIAL